MKKFLALLLAAIMVLSLAACDNSNVENTTAPTTEENPTYTYNYAMSEFPSTWNFHTYQTDIDAEILDYISVGFYTFDYNETKDGYALVPEMATKDPVDVTDQYVGKFGIPEGATAQAYIINLRDDIKWEDGTAITAHDFVESAKLLLNPDAQNYRADSLYSGNMVIHNARNYLKQGQTIENQENNTNAEVFGMSDLTKNDAGVYVTPYGEEVKIAVSAPLADWLGGNSLADYVGAYGDAMFDTTAFASLAALADENGYVTLTDETMGYLVSVITFSADWGESADNVPNYLAYNYTYPELSWDEVGMFALSDTELVICIDKPLSGFYLNYSLTSSWLVNVDLYNKCASVDEDGIYTNTYCTSAETTMSYGPYKLVSFQKDKQFALEKNEHYFGHTDSNYQTTNIVVDCVKEAPTRLELFLQGKLDSYGLTKDDMETYSLSDHCYYATGDSTFAMAFNPDAEALATNQAALGENFNKTILTIPEFRMAMSFALNRAEFCLATSPTNAPAFGLYSSLIISDPESGTAYRTTDVAKNTLAKFWGVSEEYGEGKLYADIDEAIASITGYNLTKAQEMFNAAYDKAIAEGLMDADDVVEIKIGTPNNTSTFYNSGYEFLVNNYTEAVKGTKLEGKLTFSRDDTLGNAFSDALKTNKVDMLFGVGWTGSALDPYGLMEAYIAPNYQYDPSTDFSAVDLTIAIDGVDYTASVMDWYQIMAGNTTTITAADGTQKEYSCGTADEDPETRLEILGAMEEAVLLNYNFIPIMDDASASLKGQQIQYYTEEYIFGMGFGGLKYYTYEYSDAAWDAFVAANNGELDYK